MNYKTGVLKHLSKLGAMTLDLLAPRSCCGCGITTDSATLCPDCMIQLAALTQRSYCPRCGAGLGENIPPDSSGCSQCPVPVPVYQQVVRLGAFENPLAALVADLKFRHRPGCAEIIGQFLAQAIASTSLSIKPDLICPIPLHWRRRLSRGYNQSRLIASEMASGLQLPLAEELARTRNTPPQMGLTRAARLSNIKNAFTAIKPDRISGLCILLVDDVSTTGATANEAARTLVRAGASRVILAIAAKAEARAFAGDVNIQNI